VEVRRLEPGEEEVLRAIRLAALASDPTAFGSTLERETSLGPDDWTRMLGPPAATFVAAAPGAAEPIGMAWAVPSSEDAALVHLFGMWVAPDARRAGAARALLDTVVGWAVDRGAGRIELTVTEGNAPAERLYHGHGFRRTGAVDRRDRDGRDEAGMALWLDAPTGGWPTVLGAFGLEAVGPAVPVAGGALHRTWRVPTDDGDVAVKALADGGHPAWADELGRAVTFEALAWAAGTVPMAEPRRAVDGTSLVRIDGDAVRAHRWVDGPSGTDVVPTVERLHRLGRTVAAIAVAAPTVGTTADRLEWNALDAYEATVAEAHDVEAPFAAALDALAEEVARLRARMAALEACHRPMVLGHGDLHPRNTVVVDGVDVLLDWDEVAPVVAVSHLLDAAVAFAGGPHDAPPDLVRAALAGWSDAGGGPLDLDGASTPVANAGFRAVLFHAWRALGHRGVDAPSRTRSAALVPDLATTWAAAAPALRAWEARLA
jgi:GNAT superfamily N-acetyltransferase